MKYLEKKNCSIDFYQLFDKQIAVVVERLEEKEQEGSPLRMLITSIKKEWPSLSAKDIR